MEIRLLGELEVRDRGRVLTLPPSKKTRALLAYLAATTSAQPRQRLCDLLWEGPDDPRAGLRWSLTKLRAILDDGRIQTSRDHVAIEGEIDLALHRHELAAGVASLDADALERAARRIRGDFLEGLDLPDCYRFHEWCVGQRESLRRERVAILVALVDRLRARPEEALAWARARVAVDPLSEAGHIELLNLLGQLGRRREAMDQYERCKRILETELSAKPSIEVEKARMAIRNRPSSPAEARAPSPPERPRAEPAIAGETSRLLPAFVGRDDERAALDAALRAARRGEATLPFLVVGEPGMGKTRLLDELAAGLRAEGGVALVGRAFEAEMIRPYGAFIDALRSIPLRDTESTLRNELSTLLPELADGPGRASDRPQLFDAITRLLSELIARGEPILLLLDDVQWLDEASAAVVHYVARANVRGAILAMAARPGELDDNAAALRLVRTLRRERRLHELVLAPLSPADTERLVRSVAPSVDPTRIHRGAEGNPLFAIELGRAFAHDDGDGIPATLEGLLRERLERLDERAHLVIGWAATLGRSFELTHLAEVAELPTSQLLSAIEELERRGLLRSAPAGSTQFGYDFAHDLLRRAAYQRLSAPRRRMSHAHVARVLGERMRAEEALAGDVAHHAALAGDDDLAARACVLGARRCLRIFAYAEATELADRGLRHGRELDPQASLPLEIELLSIHVAAGAIRRGDELESALKEAIARAEKAARADLISAGLSAMGVLQHHRGDLAKSAASLHRAVVAGRGGDPLGLVISLANAGRCYAMLGRDIDSARSLIAEAASVAETYGINHPELAFGAACLAAYDGEYDEAMRLFHETLAGVRASGDHWRECECFTRMTMLSIDRRDWGRARQFAAELTQVAAKMGDGGSEVQVAEALAALSAFGSGDRSARSAVEGALTKLRDVDTKGMLGYVLGGVAAFELADGALAPARAHGEQSLEMARALGAEDELITALALTSTIASEGGDRNRARERLAEASALAGKYDVSARAQQMVQRAENAWATTAVKSQ